MEPLNHTLDCDLPNPSKPLQKVSGKGEKKPRKSVTKSETKPGIDSAGGEENNAELPEVDLNDGRRKRQKTRTPDGKQDSAKHNGANLSTSPLSPKRGRRYLAVEPPTTQEHQHVGSEDGEHVIEDLAVNDICAESGQPKAPDHPAIDIKRSFPPPKDQNHSGINHQSHLASDNPEESATEALVKEDGPVNVTSDAVETKPKKILRLNPNTGTIGSPPLKKKPLLLETVLKTQSKGRQRSLKSKIVTVQYGEGRSLSSSIGQKIGSILDGTSSADSFLKRHIVEAANIVKLPKSTKVSGTGPAATPHPFFIPKAASKTTNSTTVVEAPTKVFHGSKPFKVLLEGQGKPKMGEMPPSESNPQTLASAFTGFSNTSKIFKYPGAIEPAWPWKDMIHVRGHAVEEPPAINTVSLQPSGSRKLKYQAIGISAEEDLLDMIAAELCLDQLWSDIKDINTDEYSPLPSCLRIPSKHFETGLYLQRRVRKELRTWLPQQGATVPEENIKDNHQVVSRSHPALTKVYGSIATSLSAFDRSECETHAWTQKYSPASAVEVLQPGREALILKEWLQNLTVIAVEAGSSDHPNSRSSSVSRKSAPGKGEVSGKRKRKSKKLDGFVISSDEEEDMDEISEPEDAPPQASYGLLKRTVIRAGASSSTKVKEPAKLAHGVVISGPHGCGKSAAVHAVAKELDFEVFEINSSSRRSGKDILEKVGDMTRNHLVQQSHTHITTEVIDEDAQRISDALDYDLRTGRQGTMNSFVKIKDSVKAKPKPKKVVQTKANVKASKPETGAKAPPRKQKQSLILFEEVDILYEEDKQFWATVMSLLVQSKRPIIMTCNDESAVPLNTLSLHAILRFAPAPVDLAADFMLLVAASEGHLLRREAVTGLYASKNQDLRASLTELNFWCQFAVGSSRGGLDWFYPRWPPGRDIDADGNTIRIVSEGTYEAGMGCLSQDFLESHISFLHIEEETLHEVWNEWRLDGGDLSRLPGLHQWANKMQALSKEKVASRVILAMYDDFADCMSAGDLCSAGTFRLENQLLMDTTLPELTAKAREDNFLPHELLEAHPAVSFSNLGKDISLYMKSRARKYFQVDQHIRNGFEIPTELDRPSETCVLNLINEQFSVPTSIRRHDLSLAFDPISEPEKALVYSTETLEASSFDRTIALIATDLAPYVRSIVLYDANLQQERARLSNLLSEGGRSGKRMRTTRAAMSALEGGARSTTRKDKYFGPGLNPHLVLKTGCQSWFDAVSEEMTDHGAVDRRSGLEDSTKMDRMDEQDEFDGE